VPPGGMNPFDKSSVGRRSWLHRACFRADSSDWRCGEFQLDPISTQAEKPFLFFPIKGSIALSPRVCLFRSPLLVLRSRHCCNECESTARSSLSLYRKESLCRIPLPLRTCCKLWIVNCKPLPGYLCLQHCCHSHRIGFFKILQNMARKL